MSTTDFDRKIRQARSQVKASKVIREAYLSDLDDDSVIEEIAGLSDITGMVKKIGTNIQGMAKLITDKIVPFLKGLMDVIKAPFKAAIVAAAARMLISEQTIQKADALGIPEAVLATPCPFWIVDYKANGINDAQVLTIIQTHGADLPDSVHKQLRATGQDSTADQAKNRAMEAIDRNAINLLFEKWSPLTEAVEDYLDKQPNNWVVTLASKVRADSIFTRAKEHDMANYTDDEIATMIISSALSDDPDKRETLLKVAYGESAGDESESEAKWKGGIKNSAKRRYDKIQVVNRLLDIQRKSGPKSIHASFGKGVILDAKFKTLYKEADILWKRWEPWANKNKVDMNDPDAAYKGLTDYISGEEGQKGGEEGEEGLDMGPQAQRNLIMKTLASPEWYNSVWKSIGQKNIAEVQGILTTQFVAPLGKEFAKVQAVEKLADINGAPEFKTLFDDWVSGDPAIGEIYKFATENNNDEIFSRMTAMFRPILVQSFIDQLKKLDMFEDPKGKYGQLIKEAEQAGYEKDKDPAYQAYIDLRVKFGEDLFKTYEDAKKTLQPEADRAGSELVQIYEKAKGGGEGDEGSPDAAPDSDVAAG